jgi:hypothetical protein
MSTTGIELIDAERERQVSEEGWTPEHDAGHRDETIVMAAVCYATPEDRREYHGGPTFRSHAPIRWPWGSQCWKPTPDDRIRELVKAGALIAAEIDRLKRAGKDGEISVVEE